jgi:hypothetical protein
VIHQVLLGELNVPNTAVVFSQEESSETGGTSPNSGHTCRGAHGLADCFADFQLAEVVRDHSDDGGACYNLTSPTLFLQKWLLPSRKSPRPTWHDITFFLQEILTTSMSRSQIDGTTKVRSPALEDRHLPKDFQCKCTLLLLNEALGSPKSVYVVSYHDSSSTHLPMSSDLVVE